MADLINSLKTFAYSTTGTINDRRPSTGQLRIPLLNLGGLRSEASADPGFTQWRDAMRMVARLPGGLPIEFRLKLWENLSDKHLTDKGIPWSRVLAKSATPTSRDLEIADQIHKDLHRTGCTGFSGAKQIKLKSVLVAYGRWNPSVGYCQGFNMIGAMLLEMTQGDETLTLKVLIFLIEGVLPQGYFSGGLRGLAVDMAVFREILRMRKPTLHAQLCRLQGGEEQPPLIDVFTMHWFLTLFIHCLPPPSVLRIWDLVFLEGSEVLLRAALVLWAAIETRILEVRTADGFYSVMGSVTREMTDCGLMDPNSLVKCIVSVGPFPLPGLDELRQKHRAIIQQDTPYKSFFLAKRELDNLKKHYAAIRHRQKATTIILKGLEASRISVPGQRANSLFIPTTKKQTVSPKPKLRRGSSGSGKAPLAPTNNNNNNHHNNLGSRDQNVNVHRQSSNTSNNITNNKTSNKHVNNANNHHHKAIGTTKVKQTTMTWDKTTASKTGKTFRRRRTVSSSSRTTSSSSSTELCDSSDAEEEGGAKSGGSSSSEGVWSDSDNKWVKKKGVGGHKKSTKSLITLEKRAPLLQDSSKENETPPEDFTGSGSGSIGSKSGREIRIEGETLECKIEKKDDEFNFDIFSFDPSSDSQGSKELPHLNRSPSMIDTNDSQHFLEEMTKLGKSDSFYESLSKRICELQFQNLKTLSACTTVIDPKSLSLPPFPKSPIASPVSPFPPTDNFLSSQGTNSLTPSPSPLHMSPIGSVSGESSVSPAAASPITSTFIAESLHPHHPDLKSTRMSKSSLSSLEMPSLSSVDIPDICILDDGENDDQTEVGKRETPNEPRPKLHSHNRSSANSRTQSPSVPPAFSPSDLRLNLIETFGERKSVEEEAIDFPESASGLNKKDLLSSLLTSPTSPQKKSSKAVEGEDEESYIVSPTDPYSLKGKANAPSSSPFSDVSRPPQMTEFLYTENPSPLDFDSPSPEYLTTLCPGQVGGDGGSIPSESEEEIKINAVIRENILILQRLRLNRVPDLDDDEDDESYEDAEGDDEEETDHHHLSFDMTIQKQSTRSSESAKSGSGSEDRDSGAPSSSKTSLTNPHKERLSSVSSNASSVGSGRQGYKGRRLQRTNSQGSGVGAADSIIKGRTSTRPLKKGVSIAGFNPFPTVRKARLRVTKYGLYN